MLCQFNWVIELISSLETDCTPGIYPYANVASCELKYMGDFVSSHPSLKV